MESIVTTTGVIMVNYCRTEKVKTGAVGAQSVPALFMLISKISGIRPKDKLDVENFRIS